MILPILLLKWKKLLYWLFCQDKRIFDRFVKLLISLDEHGIFLSHLKSLFKIMIGSQQKIIYKSLCEKCPNTEFFLVHIFSVLSPDTGKYGQKKTRIWILFTQRVLLSRRTINRLLPATANIHLRKFRFKKRLKLV